MKKFFIIASCIAVAGFTACSSDDDIANNGAISADENSNVPIMLSMSKGMVDVTTRGTGAVGEDNNSWRGEKMNVYMLDRATFELATGYNDEPIFENTVVSAPASTDQNNIYADYGISRYYPMSGNYDFFMYHADDAATATPKKNAEGTQYVLPVTIDGSQDLMIAKADLTNAEKTALKEYDETVSRYYSAFSARKGVQPHFNLQHMLARLVFFIEPVNKKVSDKNVDGANYYGVTVESIKIKNVNTSAEFIVAWNENAPVNHIVNEGNPTEVSLKELVANETEAHKLAPFTPVKPEWDDVADKAVSKRVGESLMLFPADEYELEINMTQQPAADRQVIPFTHRQILKVPTVNGKFEAGKQYNVKFVVYGAEKIDLSLELTKWEEEGNITADFDTKMD